MIYYAIIIVTGAASCRFENAAARQVFLGAPQTPVKQKSLLFLYLMASGSPPLNATKLANLALDGEKRYGTAATENVARTGNKGTNQFLSPVRASPPYRIGTR